MSYAQSSLIQDCRRFLDDNPWETTSTTTGTGTTVAVPDGTKWAAGDVGEWAYSGTVGGEQFLVRSISSNDLTVLRGYNGTTAESHTSGDRVLKNPRYSVFQITDSIKRVINSFFPTVWKSTSTSATPSTTDLWIDSGLSGTDLTGFIDLLYGVQRYGPSNAYVGFYGAVTPYDSRLPIRFQRNIPSAEASSTVGLSFDNGFFDPSNTITVYWRARITATVSGGNYSDIDEGLLSEAVVQGTVARLLAAKEVPNISEDAAQGRSAVGSFVGVADVFDQRYRQLLSQYHDDLMNRIPPVPDQNYVPGWW